MTEKKNSINLSKMTRKQTLIVAISLLTLTALSCNKDDEETKCQWFPASSDTVYTKNAKDGSYKYNTNPTSNSVNFDGILFQSADCENITVSINGGPAIPAWNKNLGTAKLFDEPVNDMVYNTWQSGATQPITLNGFTYPSARNGVILWKHKSGLPNGEINFFFSDNIGILSVNTIYRPDPVDSPIIYTSYQLH
jgi:hypothetical protein